MKNYGKTIKFGVATFLIAIVVTYLQLAISISFGLAGFEKMNIFIQFIIGALIGTMFFAMYLANLVSPHAYTLLGFIMGCFLNWTIIVIGYRIYKKGSFKK